MRPASNPISAFAMAARYPATRSAAAVYASGALVMQPIRRWPRPIRCSTAVRAPARLSMSTLVADGFPIILPGAGDDQPVDTLGDKEFAVSAIVWGERLHEHAIAASAGLGRDAPQRLGEERVGRDLLGRLAQHQTDRVRRPSRERASRPVGMVAELARSREGRRTRSVWC